MPNYDSFYKHYANKSLDWLPMDTKELYQENLLHRYDELKKNNWIDTSFTYKFNSLGFRSQEFTTDPSIMFLGCSNTIGIGLPIEFIWPELVSKHLKMHCANLGIGGGSCDTAFRLCHGYIDKINPKIVIFLIPPGVRLELVTDDIITNHHISSPDYKNFIETWAMDDNNHYFNCEKNILGIKMLCHDRNIKVMVLETSTILDPDYSDSLARDLTHPGIQAHGNMANIVLNQI